MDYQRLRVPADRRRIGARDSCSTRCPTWRSRFDPDAIGSAAPGSAGVFALAAIPARYALERGAWAEAAKLEPHPSTFPYSRSADPLRARARRRADRRRRDGPFVDRRAAANPAAPHRRRGSLLGRAGRDSAPRRVGVAGASPNIAQTDALTEMRAAAQLRRRNREDRGHARTAGARARAARRHAPRG